jgi:hypothetical protein
VKINTLLFICVVLICLSGCAAKDSAKDIRPPLINRGDFTNFIPVLVTNEFNKEEYDFRLLEIPKK